MHGDKNNDAMGSTTHRAKRPNSFLLRGILACFSVLKPLLSVLRMPRAKKCAC
jgi:hypothetical protein